MTFKFQLDGNFPPVRNIDTFEYVVMVYNDAQVNIPVDYIVDPEDRIVSETSPSGLPNFLRWNSTSRMITGTPNAQNIGEYILSMTSEDDYSHSLSFFFKILVKRKSRELLLNPF